MLWLLACTGPNPPSDDTPDPPRLCNGSADLCDRPLDEVVVAVAHNAMNVEDEGWALPNQHHGYEQQVADGIRGFMLDVYDDEGVVTLCHASCLLGSEPLADALVRFSALLDAHPDDVFVFVIQDELEAGPVVAEFEAAGLDARAVSEGPPWPPISDWLDDGVQLLVTHEVPRDDSPPWYFAAYDGIAWDNDYASETVDDFDCAVLRGDPANPVFLLNHFLTDGIGSAELAAQANPREVLLDHVDRCEAETGDRVSWLAVDFYDVGDAMDVVATLNAR